MEAVSARNLRFSYGRIEALKGVTLTVEDGEFVVILGPNGSGKSTLLKCIAGLLPCRSVHIMGRPVHEYGREELARILAYVPQKVDPLMLTVTDAVMLGRRPYIRFTPSPRDYEVVERVMERVGIRHLALRTVNTLSGGEMQKVSIARALAQEPRILLMDEPTNNLDLKSQLEVMSIAREFAREGGTVIVVMHDVNLALRFGERFVFIRDGRVVADGGREVLTEELFARVYDVQVALGGINGHPVVVPLTTKAPNTPNHPSSSRSGMFKGILERARQS